VSCLLGGSAVSIEAVFPADPRNRTATAGTGAEHVETAARYRTLAAHPLTRFLDILLPLIPLQRLLFLAASFGLALAAAVLTRDARISALAAALWLGALVYALALTFITVVLPRYLSPIDTLIWVSNGVCLVALLARTRTA
jgi:hypothetical protein